MRAPLQDQGAQYAHRRPDCVRFAADALNGPVRVPAMARRHVVRQSRVLAVATAAPMACDALAAEEHLNRAGGEPGIDLGPGIAVGNAVKVVLDLDVVVDAHAPDAPL